MHYVATLCPHGGGYGVSFADLPGCVASGDNLDHALRMAAEALSLHVGGMIADGDALPSPSAPEECRSRDLHDAETEDYALPDGTMWQYVYFEPAKNVGKRDTLRLTVSLKQSVVDCIDEIADEMGLTRSGAIAVAANEYARSMRAPRA